MKTLEVEAVYPMTFEARDDVVEHRPWLIEEVFDKRWLYSALVYLSLQ